MWGLRDFGGWITKHAVCRGSLKRREHSHSYQTVKNPALVVRILEPKNFLYLYLYIASVQYPPTHWSQPATGHLLFTA